MINIRIITKSYFSGADGTELGLTQAGIDIIESFEINEKCCNTLKKNFKHKANQTDITTITVLDQPEANIYLGTFPCTQYSTVADITVKQNLSGDQKSADYLHRALKESF